MRKPNGYPSFSRFEGGGSPELNDVSAPRVNTMASAILDSKQPKSKTLHSVVAWLVGHFWNYPAVYAILLRLLACSENHGKDRIMGYS